MYKFCREGRVESSYLNPCELCKNRMNREVTRSSHSPMAGHALLTILLHFTDGKREAHKEEGTVPQDIPSSTQTRLHLNSRSCALCPIERGQLGQARRWEAEDISLNHKVQFRRKGKSSRRSSQGWSLALLVPGLSEGGNDAAWACAGLRSTIRQEFASNSSQNRGALGRTVQADSMGHCAWGTACTQAPLCHNSKRHCNQHGHTQRSTQAQHSGFAGVGNRCFVSKEGLSLEQRNPQRPMRRGGHEQASRPSCGLRPQARGYRHSQLTSPLRQDPLLPSDLGGQACCVS